MATDYAARMAEREKRKLALKERQDEKRQDEMLKLDELEQQHGDENVKPVWTAAGLVVIKRPPKPHMDRFQEKVLQEGKDEAKAQRRREALALLARECVLYPERAGYEQLVEEYPGIPTTVGNAAVAFAGRSEAEEAGKS